MGILSCKSCASSNVIELIGEVSLLFPGLNVIMTHPIFVFPNFVVCTDCGFIQSNLSDKELEKVRQGAATVSETAA